MATGQRGRGTGVLAVRLAQRGLDVTGIDPADASLAIAAARPGGDLVTWVSGGAADLASGSADLALMTANVAQVFLSDEDWAAALRSTHGALRRTGHLVFETLIPARAWERWNRDDSSRPQTPPRAGSSAGST